MRLSTEQRGRVKTELSVYETEIFRILLKEPLLINILNCIDDNLSIMDEELNVLWVNKIYHERLGKNYSDVIGKKCYTLWQHRLKPCQDCPCVKAFESGKIEFIERETPEGRFFFLIGIPLSSDGKKFAFEIGREITDRKLVREKYLQHLRLQTINYFINDICHHLRNILNGMQGITALLLKEVTDHKSKSRLMKLSELIERGKEFTLCLDKLRIRMPEKTVFDLNYLVISMKNLLSMMVEEAKKDVEIEFDLDEQNLLIRGDNVQIHEAVVELFKNALEAIESKGRITIRTSKEGNKVVFSIEDTGIGMSERELKRCLLPFYSSDPKKYGIGLAFVKNVVDYHDGSIEIESQPGKGTKVRILIPAAT